MERTPVRPFVALIVVQFCFASLAVVGKIALGVLPALVVAAIRLFCASVFLALIALGTARERISWPDAGKLFVLGLLGVVCNQILFLEGLSKTTAINASILIATIPVFTTAFAILLKQESARPIRIAGIALAMAGGLALVGVEGLQLRAQFAIGNLLVVLNSFSYSIYLVFSRGLLRKYRSTTVVKWTFLFGALVVTPLGAAKAATFDFSHVPTLVWWAMAWIVLIPSVLAYSLNNYALKRIRSSTVATYVFLQPVFGISLALLVLPGEHLALRDVLGGILVLLGVILVSRTETVEPLAALPEAGEAMRRDPIAATDGRPQPEPQEDHQRGPGQEAP